MQPINLAIAQLRPAKGDYAANLDRLTGILEQISHSDPPISLLLAPEAAMSGYFLEGAVRDVAVTAGTLFRDLESRHARFGNRPLDMAVGFYEVFQNRLFN